MSDNRQLQESMKRALTAIRDKQVGKTLDDMRKDIAGPEERVIDFVCACSGAPFHVRFTRASPVERFTIAAIERGGPPRQEPQPSSFWAGSADAPSASFDIADFDLSGWACPWCHASKGTVPFSFVHCGDCSGLVCTGRTSMLPNGKSWFACHDRCGSEGVLSRKLTRVDGREQQSRKHLPCVSEPPKLSGKTTPRLSGPRR